MNRVWLVTGRLAYFLAWPLNYIVLRTTTRTRVAIFCDNELLVIKNWLSDGKWSLPGGGLHRHEPPDEGAIREVQEEVGICLRAEQLKNGEAVTYKRWGLRYRCLIYTVVLETKPDIRLQPSELVAAEWRPIGNIQPVDVEPDVSLALRRLEISG